MVRSSFAPLRPLALCLLAGALLWGILATIRSSLRAGDGLIAQYYANAAWEGYPASTGADASPSTAAIAARWAEGAPDQFSIRWRGYLVVGQPGTYQFSLTSDDGSRLYVDDRLVVDNSGEHRRATATGSMSLAGGAHRVRLEFTQSGDQYEMDWAWAREGGPFVSVPAWALSQRATSYSTALTARAIDLALPVAIALTLIVAACLVLAALHPVLAAIVPAAGHLIDRLLQRLPPRFVTAAERIVFIASFALPLLLIVHAFTFWGRGVIDEEARAFIINYLRDRPILEAVFDPHLNDWHSFQARELSYLFDYIDARVFARLLDRGVLLMVPMSGAIGLIVAAAVFVRGARRAVRLPSTTVGLLLALFLSNIVVQASTGIFYRSSKILLTIALFAFLFELLRLASSHPEDKAPPAYGQLFLFGLLAALVDRQGFFFLLVAAGMLSVVQIHRWLTRRTAARLGVLVTVISAVIIAELYNRAIGPYLVHWMNGYWPDMSYQEIPWFRLDRALVARAVEMFGAQLSFFLGNTPVLLVCAAIAVGLASLTALQAGLASVGLGSLVVLLALMIMRHPPLGRIPDHAFWYYTLTMQAVLTVGLTYGISRISSANHRSNLAIQLALLLLIAGNIGHYPAHRQTMLDSRRWFARQYAIAQHFSHDFEVIRGRDRSSRELATWIQATPSGAIAEWPMTDTGFLDAVQLAYGALAGRSPLSDASGPYWESVRHFLSDDPAILRDPEQARAMLDGLRSLGVRRVLVDRHRFRRQIDADNIVSQFLRIVDSHDVSTDEDGVVTIALTGAVAPAVSDGALVSVQNATVQSDARSLQITFDRRQDVRRLRTILTDADFRSYPRHLIVESLDDSGSHVIYDASTIGAVMRMLLRQNFPAPFDIDLPHNESLRLLLRDADPASSWDWAVHSFSLLAHPSLADP